MVNPGSISEREQKKPNGSVAGAGAIYWEKKRKERSCKIMKDHDVWLTFVQKNKWQGYKGN